MHSVVPPYGLPDALSEAHVTVAREAAWIRHFLLETGYFGPDIEPILVNRDNQGSLALAENP